MATVVPSRHPGGITMTREAVELKQAIYDSDLRAPLATALINVVDVTEARFSSLEAALRKESAARQDGNEKLKRMLQVYGPSAIGRFYLCGGSTYATAGLLYAAGQRSHQDFGDMLHYLTSLSLISYDSSSLPSPPRRGIQAFRLASSLMARRRRSGMPSSISQTYSADHTTISDWLEYACSPWYHGIGGLSFSVLPHWLTAFTPAGQLAARGISEDEPAQELRLNAWLRIAQYELAVAQDVGEPFPQKLVQILHVFEEVFGCSVSQARTVLGDEFINDPSSILYG